MEMIVIVISNKDVASVNISRALLSHDGWHEKGDFQHGIAYGQKSLCLVIIEDLHLHHDHIDQQIRKELKIIPSVIIFASRHTSRSQKKTLSVHPLGNYGEALYGGKHHVLVPSAPLLMTRALRKLYEKKRFHKLDYDVCYEVTHHGPTRLEKPLIFMELGSSKTEWVIHEAGEFIASVIINTIFKYLEFKKESEQKIGLGFGGTHYGPNFKRLISEKHIAMSFICPKYYIQELDRDLISKMVNNTTEKVDYFIVDWKGTNSEDKKHLIPLLEEFNIPIKKTKEF